MQLHLVTAEYILVSFMPDQPVYSIGAAAKIVDVPAATLRAWEERYGVTKPKRSEGSQRLYSRNQIEQLKFIKSQMDAGMSAADAHRLLGRELAAGRVLAPAAALSGEPKPLILLAERDPYAAEFAEYLLRTEGYDVSIATDAKQARLLFAERSPDLVVIDLLISGGVGFRLCTEMKGSSSAQVLAVASIDAADEALAMGASAFLRKPLEPLALASLVRDLLGTSALARPSKRTSPL
jgi:DNA-binding transcriptional MerR regulator